jgi:hypothetical protein
MQLIPQGLRRQAMVLAASSKAAATVAAAGTSYSTVLKYGRCLCAARWVSLSKNGVVKWQQVQQQQQAWMCVDVHGCCCSKCRKRTRE